MSVPGATRSAIIVASDAAHLISTMEDMGWDDVAVDAIEDGFTLRMEGAHIAAGIADHPEDAMEELLARVADLFLLDAIEA